MDLICTTCGEPWDNDELHAVAEDKGTNYEAVLKAFRVDGCASLGCTHNAPENVNEKALDRAAASSALFDLMPDDPDGVAAMMEDFG